jgi:uncharacterized membrane protein
MPDPQFDRLMQVAKLLLMVGALAAALAIGAYVAVFAPGSDYSLSRSDGNWSNFGSYVGGVLGPAFAFLAFVAVLVTVWLQAKQLEHTKKQAQLEELQRVVAAVSKIIDDLLAQPAGSASPSALAQSTERSVFVVLSAAGTAALASTADYVVNASNSAVIQSAKDSLLLQASSLLIELQQLVWCLDEYEREGGSMTVARFYRNRYSAVVCWLDAIELASSSERVQTYFKPKEFRQFLLPTNPSTMSNRAASSL